MRRGGWRIGRDAAIASLAVTLLGALPAAALSNEEIANLRGPDRQAVLERGARAEGGVTIYTSLIIDQVMRPLAEAFGKKYPYLKVEYWRGESRQIIQKVLAELRTGNSIGDAIETTSIEPPLVEAGAIMPFQTPEEDVLPAQYRDPNHWSAATRCNYYGAAYNTKLVPAASAPQRYEDLLDAKWKGKLAWIQTTDSGAPMFLSNLILAWGEQKAGDFARRLAAQKPVTYDGSARALVNRVLEGEYPIALNIQLQHPLISGHAGAPVAPLPMDPVAIMCSSVMLLKGTKHPHAAMLFIDFMVGKDGQTVLRDREYLTVHPEVPPLKELQPIVPHLNGHTEALIRPADLYRLNEKSEALLNEYFQ